MSPQKSLSMLIDADDPIEVFNEVRIILSMMYRDFDFTMIQGTFEDILRLFRGEYPGYKACNTIYHDLRHTMDTVVAISRLMHGAFVEGTDLGKEYVSLGIISALMHDTGYIQRSDDMVGTGAKYTIIHIARSIDFMKQYFKEKGYSKNAYKICKNNILCTGINPEISRISFVSSENKITGMMLGTADLLGQMSSRTYLERLPFLYLEFREAFIDEYEDELDLLRKTIDFYELTLRRMREEFEGVNRYVRLHFKARWNIDKDLYMEAIEKNISYLKRILEEHPHDYKTHLRRREAVFA